MSIASLGKAVFEIGVDSGTFVQGITEMNSNVASFANKTTGMFGKTNSAFKSLDDGVFNVTKSFERMTRGFRDADPAMRKANEWLYTYRQSLERIDQQIDTTKQRLQQQNVALEQSSQRLTTQIANINALIAREKELKVTYEQASDALQRMISSGKSSQAEIDKQAAKVDTLHASWLRQIEVVKSADARLKTMRESHKTYIETIDLTKERLESMGETQKRLSNAYDLQKEKISKLKDKIKEKLSSEEKSNTTTQKTSQVINQAGNSFSLFNGKISLVLGSYNKLTSITRTAANAVVQSTSKISGVLTVAFGTVLGTAINGAAGSVQGFVQTGLDAYMSFERLDASLKQLVATELRTKDPTLSMTQALEQAGTQSKELIKWTQQLAIESPFSQDGVAQAFQMAKALGFTVDESKRVTGTLIDWAAATGKTEDAMQRVTLALGQMQAKGKVSGEELMQLTEAGLPVREILAKAFGKTTQEIVKMQEDGLIPAKDAIAAIADTLDNDFGGAAKRQSNTMAGLLNSLQDLTQVSLREFFTGTFEAIQPYLVDFVAVLTDPAVIASIKEIGNALGSVLGTALGFIANTAIPALIDGFAMITPAIQEALAYIINFGENAYSWGSDLMNQYGQGIIDAASYVIDAVMSIANTIMDWMMPHSPPKFLPHIDDWGRETAQLYFDSFGDADFKAIEDVGKKVEDMLSGMKASGDLDKNFNVSSAVLGSREAMIAATQEFKRFGRVTQETLQRIRTAGGPVGDMMADYAQSLFKANAANEQVAKAQANLNKVTGEYDAKLAAIDKRMKALQGKQNDKDIDKRIAQIKHQMANAAKLPASIRPDTEKLQNELEQLQLQKDREAVEAEKDTATAIAQVQVDAAQQQADVANAELQMRQNLLEAQQEQIDLIKQQIELQKQMEEEGKDSEKDSDAEAKKAAAEAKKREAEAKRVADAQFATQMASADAAGQVELLQQKLNSLTPGTEEYYKVQKQLITAQERLTNEQQKANKVDFEASLVGKDKNEQIALYQQYLDTLTPGTAEYTAAQKKLLSLQEDQQKSTEQVTEAEWQATFASKDRAGQIEMLKEKLGGLQEGTKEYYDTLKQLNSLEKAEANAKDKKGKGKGKGGTPEAGSLYKNPLAKPIADATEMGGKIVTLGERLKAFFEPVNARAKELNNVFTTMKTKFDGANSYVSKFSGILGALGGTLTVILVHQFWTKILQWVEYLKPLLAIFQALFSPIGLLVIAVAALGAAWATNFGNIRGIAAGVWQSLEPVFKDLSFYLGVIISAFQNGGLEAGFNKLFQFLPLIGNAMLEIISKVFDGIAQFFSSEDMKILLENIAILLEKVGMWMLTTGIPLLLRIFGGLWGSIAAAAITYGPTLIAAVSKLIGQLGANISTTASQQGPKIIKSIQDWLKGVGDAIKRNLPFVRVAVSALLVGLVDLIVRAITTVGPYLMDAATSLLKFLIPAIPDVISELMTLVMSLGLWLINVGVPMIGTFLADAFDKGIAAMSAILPELGFNLGRLIGSTLSKALVLAISLLMNLPSWLGALATWLWNSFLPGLGSLLIAVVRGAFGLLAGVLLGIAEPFVQTASAMMTDIGQKVMEALGLGINGNVAFFLNSLINGFNMAVTWVKEFLGIEGEGGASAKFNEIGQGIVFGLKLGWDAIIASLDAAILAWLDTIAAVFGTNKETLVLTVYQLYQGITSWWTTMQNDINTIIGNLVLDQLRFWTGLRDDALKLIGTFWDGLVGAAGWITKIKADVTTIITELVNLLTGNGGSFPVLKDKALQLIKDMWDGIVGTGGWITKLKADAGKLIEDLKTNALRILGDFLKGVTQFGNDAWDGLLGKDGWITKLVGDLPKKMGQMVDDTKDYLKKLSDWIANGTTGFGKMVYDSAVEVGKQLIDGLESGIQSMWESLKGWLADKFSRWFDNWWSNKQDSTESNNENPGGAAVGTQYATGGRMWVGEDGPELLDLPRGSKVMTNTKSAMYFNDIAKNMAARLDAVMNATLESMGRMQMAAQSQVGQAASQFITTSNETNNATSSTSSHMERHDHWNLTIVSQAREEQVVHDFDTMMAMAGANS